MKKQLPLILALSFVVIAVGAAFFIGKRTGKNL